MLPKIPEKNKKPGVYYVLSDDGVELPVIDITHPAFAENATPQQLAALEEDFYQYQSRPAFFKRFFSSRSRTMRGMDAASGKFLGGMTTYIAKLSPGMLGKGYSGFIDRRVAGAVGSVSFRIRLQDMARLLGDGLQSILEARPTRTAICLLNIGGGPAMDSLNALLLLHKQHPQQLAGRTIFIQVLDLDTHGPAFGRRAAAALLAEGAPLHGLELTFAAEQYDWSNPSALRAIFGKINAEDALIGSSEGGLFEYGSDAIITQNLQVLRECTPADFVMVGSLVRNAKITRILQETSKIPLRTFRVEEFRNIVSSAGWVVDYLTEYNPIYQVARLKKG